MRKVDEEIHDKEDDENDGDWEVENDRIFRTEVFKVDYELLIDKLFSLLNDTNQSWINGMSIFDKTEISTVKSLINMGKHEIDQFKGRTSEFSGLKGQFMLLERKYIQNLQGIDSIVADLKLVM